MPGRVRPAASFRARYPELELGDCLLNGALRLDGRIYGDDLDLQLEGAPPLAHGSVSPDLATARSVSHKTARGRCFDQSRVYLRLSRAALQEAKSIACCAHA